MTDDVMPLVLPDWPAPQGVHAFITTRQGGVSSGAFSSLNLGRHVDDAPANVGVNRARLRALLPAEPVWLKQVHGTHVVNADVMRNVDSSSVEADAAVARKTGTVCVVMTADCLPVLFASRDGSVVAVAHAGWRGLCAGVLEKTVKAMSVPAADIIAYLGPAIGPAHFEVGPEVRTDFIDKDSAASVAFRQGTGDRWMADIFLLARQRLGNAGLAASAVYGGRDCTVSDAERFYSYRRDGKTGRMAAVIWRA